MGWRSCQSSCYNTLLYLQCSLWEKLCMERYLHSGLLCWRQRNRPFGNGESHALRIFFGGLKDSRNSFTLLLVNVCVWAQVFTHSWNHLLSPFRLLPHVLNIADNHLVQTEPFLSTWWYSYLTQRNETILALLCFPSTLTKGREYTALTLFSYPAVRKNGIEDENMDALILGQAQFSMCKDASGLFSVCFTSLQSWEGNSSN